MSRINITMEDGHVREFPEIVIGENRYKNSLEIRDGFAVIHSNYYNNRVYIPITRIKEIEEQLER